MEECNDEPSAFRDEIKRFKMNGKEYKVDLSVD